MNPGHIVQATAGLLTIAQLQPITLIFPAKSILLYQRLKRLVAGCDDANVDRFLLVGANRLHDAPLNHVQQFGLKIHGKVIDII